LDASCRDAGPSFALVGAAGFVAERHLRAIRDVGGTLAAAVDPRDSVGVIDRYFPEADFFTEIERFDRFLEKRRRGGAERPVDYISICSPNYLHDAHARLALRVGANAICEKPLVINPWNLDQLADLEREYGRRVFTVLQLRLHPVVQRLKAESVAFAAGTRDIVLTYVTRRGKWYHQSWKGSEEKSGGLAMNIGIHFFDVLLWLYGPVQRFELHLAGPSRMAGLLELRSATVRWFLSIDVADLPPAVRDRGGFAHRAVTVDGRDLDLSDGFTDLHTEVYRDVLGGGGFGVEDSRPAIELVHGLRTARVAAAPRHAHPLLAAQPR
jgi:UDP-N-acetyl-2-amino-2-deoxyglucuronate dehydrogenase